jgi:YidC/Oxa1 family membrane protein insertase
VDKRLVTFLLVATVIMMGWMLLSRVLLPQPQVVEQAERDRQEQPEDADGQRRPDDQPEPGDDKEPVGDGEQPGVEEPAEQPAEAPLPEDEPAQEKIERQWVTLGSADPSDPYRLLVTLVNTGAAIERIELSDPRYRDLEDVNGYLGHLSLEKRTEGKGLRVNIVGRGTPAAKAVCATSGVPPGLKVGDVILSAGDSTLHTAEDLKKLLKSRRPGDELSLKVLRASNGGQRNLEFTAVLGRRPLEVVRPELPEIRDRNGRIDPTKVRLPRQPHPLSFLATLDKIASEDEGAEIARGESEIRGLPSLTQENWEVVRDAADPDAVEFRFVLTDEQLRKVGGRGPLEITKRFRLAKVPPEQQENRNYRGYHLDYEIRIRNLSDASQPIAYRQLGPTGLPVEGWWYSNKVHPTRFAAVGTRDVIFSLTDRPHTGLNLIGCPKIVKRKQKHPDDPEETMYRREKAAPLRFAGGDSQYFAAVLLPDPQSDIAENYTFPESAAFVVGEINSMNRKLTNVTYRLTSEAVELAPGESLEQDFVIFAGPKSPRLLDKYDLGDTIVYGWFWWVSWPLLKLLHLFYQLTGELSYGLAIIMLTVLVRACMFPLSRKQVLSAQKMQELAPEMKRIAEKYKDDMQKKAAAQQELFRKHNYNPLGGCLLVFFQLPVFIGLYRCLSVDIELRQAPLIDGVQWCSNLAAPDKLWYWGDSFIPFFDFLVGPNGFLGPYLNILPLFTVALFLVQQKLFTPPATDEQQKMQQQMMTFMMLFIGVLFFRVPSGLCIYFIASSLWGVAERKLLPKVTKKTEQPQGKPSKAKVEVAAKKAKRKKARQRK